MSDCQLVVSVLEDLEAPFEPQSRYAVKVNGQAMGHVIRCSHGWYPAPEQAEGLGGRGRRVHEQRLKAVFELLLLVGFESSL